MQATAEQTEATSELQKAPISLAELKNVYQVGVPIHVRPAPGKPLVLYACATKDGCLQSPIVHCVYAVNMCKAPVVAQLAAGKLRMHTTTTGAKIRYTLDGSQPQQTSLLWDPATPAMLDMSSTADQIVQARAFKENLVPSEVAVLRVSIGQVIRPQIVVVEDSRANDQYEITTATANATIEFAVMRFSVGHDPTINDAYEWAPYTLGSVVTVDRTRAGTIAIVARASKSEMVTSDVVLMVVEVEKLSPPNILRDATTLVLEANDDDVEIWYSLEHENRWEVYNPIDRPLLDLSGPGQTVYNAKVIRPGHETSEVTTSSIIVQQAPLPTINFALEKLHLQADRVHPPWRDEPAIPKIYYTINGPTPDPIMGTKTVPYNPDVPREIDTDRLTELSIKALATCAGFANSHFAEHIAERVGDPFRLFRTVHSLLFVSWNCFSSSLPVSFHLATHVDRPRHEWGISHRRQHRYWTQR